MPNEPLMGTISMFTGQFAPRGWAFCNGQVLRIAEHTALYSILRARFGGDGKTTFALPNLQGRFPVHPCAGPTPKPRTLGARGGSSSVTLAVENLPPHTHDLEAPAGRDVDVKESSVLGGGAAEYSSAKVSGTMRPDALAPAGKGVAVDVQNPYTCVSFIISLTGAYPPS